MILVKSIRALLLVAYPLLVYVGLERWGARWTALLLLGVVVASLLLRWLAPERDEHRPVLLPAVSAVLVLGAVLSGKSAFLLVLPALINLTLLAAFALTLRTTPMAERFARRYVRDLRPEEIGYCRGVTRVWCWFFAVNAGVSLATAVWGLRYWSLYNGVLAYALSGLLFASEYLLRKYRFRRFGPALHDRVLQRFLPAPRDRS